MEAQLLNQALQYHGSDLINVLQKEQDDSSQIQIQPELCNSLTDLEISSRDSNRELHNLIVSFVAKKADMFLVPHEPAVVPITSEAEDQDFYAIMPPLERFMFVSQHERLKHFYKCLEKGDILVGSVSGKLPGNLIIKLLCMSGGLRRDIEDLNIQALCNIQHIPQNSSHSDPLDSYQNGDLLQGVVLDVNLEEERILLSMKDENLLNKTGKLKLGLISEEDVPYHFRKERKHCYRLYEEILHNTLGFMNPSSMTHLAYIMGLNIESPPSFMRGLYNMEYNKEECAPYLYKIQSAKWAYKSVMEGIKYLKEGNTTEAFQCLNKSLQIDPQNVEALVARGALCANNSRFQDAIVDFNAALKIDPTHANALKFSVETLVAIGKQHEEKDRTEEAIRCYHQALKINPNYSEAIASIKLSQEKEKARQMLESAAKMEPKMRAKRKQRCRSSETAIMKEKLRTLLHQEKHTKERRHKRKLSSSSSSSTTSSSSLSSGETTTTTSTQSSISSRKSSSSIEVLHSSIRRNSNRREPYDKMNHKRKKTSSSSSDNVPREKELIQRDFKYDRSSSHQKELLSDKNSHRKLSRSSSETFKQNKFSEKPKRERHEKYARYSYSSQKQKFNRKSPPAYNKNSDFRYRNRFQGENEESFKRTKFDKINQKPENQLHNEKITDKPTRLEDSKSSAASTENKPQNQAGSSKETLAELESFLAHLKSQKKKTQT